MDELNHFNDHDDDVLSIFNEKIPIHLHDKEEVYMFLSRIFGKLRYYLHIMILKETMNDQNKLKTIYETIVISLNDINNVITNQKKNTFIIYKDILKDFINLCIYDSLLIKETSNGFIILPQIRNDDIEIEKSFTLKVIILIRLYMINIMNELYYNDDNDFKMNEFYKLYEELITIYSLKPEYFHIDNDEKDHYDKPFIYLLIRLIHMIRKESNIDMDKYWIFLNNLFNNKMIKTFYNVKNIKMNEIQWSFIILSYIYSSYNSYGLSLKEKPLGECWKIICSLIKDEMSNNDNYFNNDYHFMFYILERVYFFIKRWDMKKFDIFNIIIEYFINNDDYKKNYSFMKKDFSISFNNNNNDIRKYKYPFNLFLDILIDYISSSSNCKYHINQIITIIFTHYHTNNNQNIKVNSTENMLSLLYNLIDLMDDKQKDSLPIMMKGKLNYSSSPYHVRKILISQLFLFINKINYYDNEKNTYSKGHEKLSNILSDIFNVQYLQYLNTNDMTIINPYKRQKISEYNDIRQYTSSYKNNSLPSTDSFILKKDQLEKLLTIYLSSLHSLYKNHPSIPTFSFINNHLRSILSSSIQTNSHTIQLRRYVKKIIACSVYRSLTDNNPLFSKLLSQHFIDHIYPECQSILTNESNPIELLYIAVECIAIMSPVLTKNLIRSWNYYFREYAIHINSSKSWITHHNPSLRIIPFRFAKTLLQMNQKLVLAGNPEIDLNEEWYSMIGIWINYIIENDSKDGKKVLDMLKNVKKVREMNILDGIIIDDDDDDVWISVLNILFENIAIYYNNNDDDELLRRDMRIMVKYIPYIFNEKIKNKRKDSEMTQNVYILISKMIYEIPYVLYYDEIKYKDEYGLIKMIETFFIDPMIKEEENIMSNDVYIRYIPNIIQGLSYLDYNNDKDIQYIILRMIIVILNTISGQNKEDDLIKIKVLSNSLSIPIEQSNIKIKERGIVDNINNIRHFFLKNILRYIIDSSYKQETFYPSIIIIGRFIRILFNILIQSNIITMKQILDECMFIYPSIYNAMIQCDPLNEGIMAKKELYSFIYDILRRKKDENNDIMITFIQTYLIKLIEKDIESFIINKYNIINDNHIYIENDNKIFKEMIIMKSLDKEPYEITKTKLNIDDISSLDDIKKDFIDKLFGILEIIKRESSISFTLKKIRDLLSLNRINNNLNECIINRIKNHYERINKK